MFSQTQQSFCMNILEKKKNLFWCNQESNYSSFCIYGHMRPSVEQFITILDGYFVLTQIEENWEWHCDEDNENNLGEWTSRVKTKYSVKMPGIPKEHFAGAIFQKKKATLDVIRTTQSLRHSLEEDVWKYTDRLTAAASLKENGCLRAYWYSTVHFCLYTVETRQNLLLHKIFKDRLSLKYGNQLKLYRAKFYVRFLQPHQICE